MPKPPVGVSQFSFDKFRDYRSGAIARHMDFSLTCQEFHDTISRPCHYCGVSKRDRGLDRVDNTKGYVQGNVVACCTTCNRMKHAMPETEFINQCMRIAAYNKLDHADIWNQARVPYVDNLYATIRKKPTARNPQLLA
jgi:hypothetical protein